MRNLGKYSSLVCGIGCYLLWGTLPLFWKLLSATPAAEVQANRMLWCAVAVFTFCLISHNRFSHLLRDKRAIAVFAASGLLITINWSVYIYSINAGDALSASLGSYLTPPIDVLFGILIFREHPSRLQTVGIVLAAIGVAVLTLSSGTVPVVALILALSFAAYGTVKKWGGYPATQGMAMESLFTGPLALVVMVATLFSPTLFATITPVTAPADFALYDKTLVVVFLIIGGIVTWLPLQLFASAVNGLSMITVSFCQYISPTICFLLAVFCFGEPFTWAHAFCFGCIWVGIIIEIIHEVRLHRAAQKPASPAPERNQL